VRPRSEKSFDNYERCGRCADLLPEVPLSFCPSCGVPFSETPPTQSYTPLADHSILQALKKERRRWTAIASALVLAFLTLQFFFTAFQQKSQIRILASLIRPLDIYVYDFENLPKLDNSIKRQSLGIALTAFEDHFGKNITDISYRENKLPREFEPLFNEIQNLNSLSEVASSLSFWEQKVYPELTKQWARNPLAPLPIIITNLPLYVDNQSSAQIETRHLGRGKLISGLGHPAFVLISTYRLHPENSRDRVDTPKVKDNLERARFLGEFVLAHELGHALLGLPDYVETSHTDKNILRNPASVDKIWNPEKLQNTSECLMHTDAGGGFMAWEILKNRKLGTASQCEFYTTTQEALKKREDSVKLLKAGYSQEAYELHKNSVQLFKQNSPSWLTQLVQKENFLFSSALSYWRSQIFMVESKE
jgi:hypothetical protein